jgi:hypothetical protein
LHELHAGHGLTRDAAPLTARLLLTHSAGLPWDDTWGAVSFGFDDADLDRLLFSGLSFARVPGTTFEYSNLGYALLGRLVTRVSGSFFHDYVTQHILYPLGMSSTVWAASAVPKERLAVGYWGKEEPLAEAPRIPDGVFEPAGGLYTSLHDYAHYLAFQLSAYPPRDAPEYGPVRRSTLREMHQAQRRARGPGQQPIAHRMEDGVALTESNYGFGWFNETSCTYEGRLEHRGWEPGYSTSTILLPQQRIAVVTLATTRDVQAVDGMLKLLHEAGALPPADEPVPSAELLATQGSVIQLLDHWDPAVAEHTFEHRSINYPWYIQLPKSLGELARVHGRCQSDGALHASDRLSGSWKMQCERGAVEFTVVLTPTSPAKAHLLRWTEHLPPDERMSHTAAQLTAALTGGPEPLLSLLAPSLDRERVRKQLAHAAIDHGACSVERAIAGNGNTKSVFELVCSVSPLELSLEIENDSGRVVALDLHHPRDRAATCWH